MTDRPDHATAETAFRALLRDHGMPDPDEVAHWRDALVFGWHDSKTIVVVDLDEGCVAVPTMLDPAQLN